MNKQQEIREGIADLILNQLTDVSPWQGKIQLSQTLANGILKKLHSQGIKLPDGSSLLETP